MKKRSEEKVMRKAYAPPKLVVYGNVRDLTLDGGGRGGGRGRGKGHGKGRGGKGRGGHGGNGGGHGGSRS